ncbi:hypothetical protein KOI35_45505 [Actinoplanes bogorensis]|uniref:histidine kinase n=1 Tax=Paractinoplanes bogorensis TaxID=1610840 RepID=A0ABS5Z517_9ACTN|nr:sensor histidine kinase [Actinoplanes bogorensis]MBU2670782.1 hypothetical protein [Actinoplanes bogorensis]
MSRWKVWLLPALLAAAQLAYWPSVPSSTLDAAGAALIVVVAAGLCLRRDRPVTAIAIVSGGLALGTWALPQQEYFFPGDALLVLAVAELVALFHVALRRDRRTTVLVVGALLVVQAALLFDDEPLDILTSVFSYAIVIAAARVRRRWLDDRTAAAHRLAEAEEARRDAAAAEQRRLARELHDVTAHHLTSIVVNGSAAQFVGTPELTAEALAFAARAGGETLEALRRLVAVLPAVQASASLDDLADDFRQLGQVVHLSVTGTAPAEMREALHGIAREALTNTLRYAPGATVRIAQTYDEAGATLVVADDGASASGAATGLGGGRGLTGMRERAAAFGGTVTAGPREGGWEVRAVLKAGADKDPARLRVWLRSQVVLDAALLLLTLLMPLAGVSALVDEGAVSPAALTLILLTVAAHSVPLLWRRRWPWPVLAAVLLTSWLGPVLVATGVTPAADAWLFLFSSGAEFAAVYAVAAYGSRPRLTWIGVAAALFSASAVVGVLLAVAGPDDPELPTGPGTTAGLLIFGMVFAWFVLGLPFAGSWLAGFLTRRRRERRLDHEARAVAVVSAEAELRARDERARVAAGLQASVLASAARVTQRADAGDLDGALDAAREALAAMRGLLDGLRPSAAKEEVPSSPSVS